MVVVEYAYALLAPKGDVRFVREVTCVLDATRVRAFTFAIADLLADQSTASAAVQAASMLQPIAVLPLQV